MSQVSALEKGPFYVLQTSLIDISYLSYFTQARVHVALPDV